MLQPHIHGLCDYCELSLETAPGVKEWRVTSGSEKGMEEPVVVLCIACADTCHHCGIEISHESTGGICSPH